MLVNKKAVGIFLGVAALFAALVLLAASLPASSSAKRGCGGVEREKPTKDANLGKPPLAVGDSPMLLALTYLADKGFRANARGCRFFDEGLDLIDKLEEKDKLPRLVVIALGANGSITTGQIHDALDIVGKKRILGLVTPRESGGGSSSDAEHIRDEAKKHENRIVLLDWVEYSAGHGSWFQPDGLHLTFDGAEAMADLIAKSLKLLPPPKKK